MMVIIVPAAVGQSEVGGPCTLLLFGRASRAAELLFPAAAAVTLQQHYSISF